LIELMAVFCGKVGDDTAVTGTTPCLFHREIRARDGETHSRRPSKNAQTAPASGGACVRQLQFLRDWIRAERKGRRRDLFARRPGKRVEPLFSSGRGATRSVRHFER